MKKVLILFAFIGVLAGCARSTQSSQGASGTETGIQTGGQTGTNTVLDNYLSYPNSTNF